MRKLILLAVVAGIASGCGPKVTRTGSICVEPFTATGFKTNNPIDVKQDVADNLTWQLNEEIPGQIKDETKLKYVSSCQGADLKLSGAVTRVNAATSGSSGRIFGGGRWSQSQMSFGIYTMFTLQNNRNNQTILTAEKGEGDKTDLSSTLHSLAEKIAKTIKYLTKSEIPTVTAAQ